jgi:hypothetical protein
MRVTINGGEVDVSSSGIRTLGELLEAVQEAAAERNEVVVSVALNGEALGPDRQAAEAGRELGEADAVDLAVQEASALLKGALQVTRDALPALEGRMEQVATALQSGSRQEAFSLFSDCLTQWRQVVQLLQVSQACLDYDPAEVLIEGQTLQDLNAELLTTLTQTKRAMEEGDLVALSDLLEYELVARLRQEQVVLERLIGMVPGTE